jgi:hypothetical protein
LVTAIAFNLFYSHCLFQQFMLAPILHALKTHITHILNQLATNRNGFPTEMDSLIMSRFLDQMLFDQQVFKPRVIVEEPGRTYFLPPLSVFLAAAFNKPVFVSLEAPAGDAFGFRALRSLVTVQAVATTCPAVAKVSSATLAAESPNLCPTTFWVITDVDPRMSLLVFSTASNSFPAKQKQKKMSLQVETCTKNEMETN